MPNRTEEDFDSQRKSYIPRYNDDRREIPDKDKQSLATHGSIDTIYKNLSAHKTRNSQNYPPSVKDDEVKDDEILVPDWE